MHQRKKRRQPLRPTAAQFEAHPQAKQIRDVCLEAIGLLTSLQQGGEQDVQDASARLERLNARLIELGCYANMECGLALARYNEPLTMARYAAGQLLVELNERIITLKQIVPIIQEFGRKIGPVTAWKTSGSNLPAPVRSYLVTEMVLASIRNDLDAAP